MINTKNYLDVLNYILNKDIIKNNYGSYHLSPLELVSEINKLYCHINILEIQSIIYFWVQSGYIKGWSNQNGFEITDDIDKLKQMQSILKGETDGRN